MSTKSRFVAAVGLIIVVGAFLAGFWPERQRRTALDRENESLRAQVEALDDHERLARLHGRLLDLIDAVSSMNYGEAQTGSSSLFNSVRLEASHTHNAEYREVLEQLLATRDDVTAALAKGDAASLEPLRRSERELRRVLAKPTSGGTSI
jgi:hypothetical protein